MIKRVKSTYENHLKSKRKQEKIIIKQTALRCVVYVIHYFIKHPENKTFLFNRGIVSLLEYIGRDYLLDTYYLADEIYDKFSSYMFKLNYFVDRTPKCCDILRANGKWFWHYQFQIKNEQFFIITFITKILSIFNKKYKKYL